jgi:hypothetical protein
MKKLLGLIVAAMLLCGFAGQAGATNFAKGDLIRVIYGGGNTVEYATDLGSLTSLENKANTQTAGDTFTAYAGTGFGTMNVAYYVWNATSYIGSPVSSTTPPGTTQATWGASVYGNMSALSTEYKNSFISGSTITASVSNVSGVGDYASSYVALMNVGGSQPGTYGAYLTSGTGETSLATLASGGSVDVNLYAFASTTQGAGTLLTNTDGTIFDIRTLANGSTQIIETAAPVPIPPSMLLLGTGLLGLIGLRRKGA